MSIHSANPRMVADADLCVRNASKCSSGLRKPTSQGLSVTWSSDRQILLYRNDRSFENSPKANDDYSKEKLLLEDALANGNVTYAKLICGLIGSLTEFCIRGNADAVNRILASHADLARSTTDVLIPPIGSVVNGSKRVITEEDHIAAYKTLNQVKKDLLIREAFQIRDVDQLEALYGDNLKIGVLEACRRDDVDIALILCRKLYRQAPFYRQLNAVYLPEETPAVQEMMQKVHTDVCEELIVEDANRPPEPTSSKSCSIM